MAHETAGILAYQALLGATTPNEQGELPQNHAVQTPTTRCYLPFQAIEVDLRFEAVWTSYRSACSTLIQAQETRCELVAKPVTAWSRSGVFNLRVIATQPYPIH